MRLGWRHGRDSRRRALLFALLLAGCATTPRPPAGYVKRVDDLGAVDAGPLTGKRIALDPGHGGFFRGALGVRGLSEAEVNLGVALDLATLLREHGAQVVLTRETDRDYLTPADSSLRSDLTARMKLANEFHPDLFLSIHHNADPHGSHQVNETRVYFQLGDEGPALEAAADVQRFLARNLGITPSRVLPGNYAVLRMSEAPGLLTESSYLTYPATEQRLKTPDARQLEAEALYLGIAAYFQRRAPVVDSFAAWQDGSPLPDSARVAMSPALRATIRGAFDDLELRLDGAPVEPMRTGSSLEWHSETPLAPGFHTATLIARLSGEGSSRRAAVAFELRSAPERLVADAPDQPWWDGNQPIGLRCRLLDREGNLVPDTLVRVLDLARRSSQPPDTTLRITDGVGWAYLWPPSPSRRDTAALHFRFELAGTNADRGRRGAKPIAATLRLPVRHGVRPPVRTGFALTMPDGAPLRAAPGTREPDARLAWINRDGFLRLPAARADSGGLPALDGYRPWVGERAWPPRWVAIAGGALHGRRIVIDPAGGGDDPAGTSASGGRGASLNLEVARSLAAMLESAGAEVRLTRNTDASMSELARVQLAEGFHADRFVRIGHAAEAPRVGFYFSSAGGKRWAGRLADLAAGLGLPRPTTGEDAQYPIQQTSATAIYAGLGRVDDPAAPLGRLSPARLRTEAYAVYLSLAGEWPAPFPWASDSLQVQDGAGRPLSGAPVRLGDALVLETDALGRIRFERTEPGPLLIEVLDDRAPLRRILLDSERGITLPGPVSR
ncbi:MAG TPA: N-acetylmuramoyl-L-alanine amidase [Candidatus Sulfotelmatobacter sp.]|nr:N-acetylmuramoyl-L-alanine amidase [Candidatus Sulfotelmatobacter sp.]